MKTKLGLIVLMGSLNTFAFQNKETLIVNVDSCGFEDYKKAISLIEREYEDFFERQNCTYIYKPGKFGCSKEDISFKCNGPFSGLEANMKVSSYFIGW
jgi:hypothetical protein